MLPNWCSCATCGALGPSNCGGTDILCYTTSGYDWQISIIPANTTYRIKSRCNAPRTSARLGIYCSTDDRHKKAYCGGGGLSKHLDYHGTYQVYYRGDIYQPEPPPASERFMDYGSSVVMMSSYIVSCTQFCGCQGGGSRNTA